MADTAARFHALAEDAVEDLLRLEPERATDLGDHRFDDRLTDLSEEGLAACRRPLADHRDELDSLDAAELKPADAVDAEILRAGLDRRLFELQQLREHTWNPLAWLPGEAIYLLLPGTRPVEDRLNALGGRLEAVPERLATARVTLRDMPRVHVETALTPDLRADRHAARARCRRWPGPRRGRSCGWSRCGPRPRTRWSSTGTGCSSSSTARTATRALGPSCSRPSCTCPSTRTCPPTRSSRPPGALDRVSDELTELAVGWVGPGDDAVRRALDRAAAEAPDDAPSCRWPGAG